MSRLSDDLMKELEAAATETFIVTTLEVQFQALIRRVLEELKDDETTEQA